MAFRWCSAAFSLISIGGSVTLMIWITHKRNIPNRNVFHLVATIQALNVALQLYSLFGFTVLSTPDLRFLNLFWVVQNVALTILGFLDLQTLQLFSILDSRITKERIWMAKYLLGFLCVLFNSLNFVGVYYNDASKIPTIQAVTDMLSFIFAVICVIYDNGQTFFIALLVLRNHSTDVNRVKARKEISDSFKTVVLTNLLVMVIPI